MSQPSRRRRSWRDLLVLWKAPPILAAYLLGAASALLIEGITVNGNLQEQSPNGLIVGLLGIACGLLALLAAGRQSARESVSAKGEAMLATDEPLARPASARAGDPRLEEREEPVQHQPTRFDGRPTERGAEAHSGPVGRFAEAEGALVETTGAASPLSSPSTPSPPPPAAIGNPMERAFDGEAPPSPRTAPPGGSQAIGPTLDHAAISAAWQQYLERGDGRFEARGFRRHLDEQGVAAEVEFARELGVEAPLLAVLTRHGRQLYLVPDFNQPARAVADWFVDQGSGERMARIKRLLEVAEAERADNTLRLLKKGVVA